MAGTRREFLHTALAPAAPLLQATTGAAQATRRSAAGRRKVIYDQDHRGPLSTDTIATLMLLQADNVDVLGITIVAGDQWVEQETAYALRLLELLGRTEIPVYKGAVKPLLNRKEEAQARYRMFGGRRLESFLGAMNADHPGPTDVMPLPAPYDRFAQKQAEREHAVDFIIRTIRQNPGEVTVFCGGPLTNLALAAMMAPDIVPLTREVVFMGGGIHHSTSSFNVYFDAEAAKVAFRAGFPKFSVVTVDLAETMHMGDAGMVEEIVARAPFPINDLFRRYEQPRDAQGRLVVDPALLKHNPNLRWFRLPDEMMAAQIIDPTVFGGYDEMYVDVATANNGHYGSTQWWDKGWEDGRLKDSPLEGQNRPSPRAKVVQVLKGLDKDRFRALFVGLLTRPIRKV